MQGEMDNFTHSIWEHQTMYLNMFNILRYSKEFSTFAKNKKISLGYVVHLPDWEGMPLLKTWGFGFVQNTFQCNGEPLLNCSLYGDMKKIGIKTRSKSA